MQRRRRSLALRERQDVGRLVLVAELAVELADLAIGGQPEPDLEVGALVRAGRGADHPADLGDQAPLQHSGERDSVVDREVERHC